MPFVYANYPSKDQSQSTDYQISMAPLLMGAVADLIRHYDWKNIFYLYDSDLGQSN